MTRNFRYILVILFSIVFLSLSNKIHAEKYTPAEDGKFSVKCSCVIVSGLCNLKIMDGAKARNDWYIDQYGKAGQEIDLNASCWRKRDAKNTDEGTCCTVENDEKSTIESFFTGVKQN